MSFSRISASHDRLNNTTNKVIFIMGSTATGKTKLSITLATLFPAEIINSDKIQVYEGLNIISNKVTEDERRGVPHHLLGFMNPEDDFTAQDFCHHTLTAIQSIVAKGCIPIIVGGSNSYVQALMEDETIKFRDNFDCCFLWMDASLPVLCKYVGKRVDRMVDSGLVDEVREMFDPQADYTRGVRRAIGALEMHKYFQVEGDMQVDEATKRMLLEACIEEIKENTCKLAKRQLEKIQRLRNELGWEIHRIDATSVLEKSGKDAEEAWEKVVMRPSLAIVRQFLNKLDKGRINFKEIIEPSYSTYQFPEELSVTNYY